GVELVHPLVDGVLELENFAFYVDGDLARQVAARHRGRYFGNVADLRGEIRGEQVDVVGEVLPGAGNARHVGLAAETAFGADLARHARHFAGKRAELVGGGVERFLQLQKLATHVDGDLLGKIAASDSGRHLGDIADLRSQVRRHEVDVVRQVLPGACDFRHLG